MFCSSVLVQAAAASGASGQVDPGPSPAEHCAVQDAGEGGGGRKGTCQGIVSIIPTTSVPLQCPVCGTACCYPGLTAAWPLLSGEGKLRLRRVTSIVNKLDTEK